ncbi:radical SAM family heme chaperone HemW [Pseudodesulfovibrio sp. JC047]|uniref:radical SAM family heme chaperone HemW n=1 Tax=Pseudodesulfovibrio sp. JC047 TaxID=2683199 RepID=UPI0013D8D42C|nr:radical SAM family heme chaperone HemW [Pseudodesulfovibrio sp. JC047]NDV18244.1 radical SAM family heme chaperone HemW [Pseudodesulfovibrio sp. JC047]
MGKIYGEDVPVTPAFPDAISKRKKPSSNGTGLLLYIHVPFCVSRCTYCNFHSQIYDAISFARYYSLLLEEIKEWGRRLKRPRLRTIYFGGGTPSLVPLSQLETIMKTIRASFTVNDNMEVTLEANPDSAHDVSYFKGLLSIGFNRLSLGMQSCHDGDLQVMGRPHSVDMTMQSYSSARQAGIGNIGLDLIWGLPGQKLKGWLDQLKMVAEMRPDHLSAYNLTLESGTRMAERCGESGDLELPSDTEQGRMFVYGAEYLESMGYMQYEVSNFARMGFMSVHNSGYWTGSDYLGLGPSAVSTIGRRRFSVPWSLDEYDTYVRDNLLGKDFEELSDSALLTELVMLSLRTSQGLDLAEYRTRTGHDLVKRHESLFAALHRENLIRINQGWLKLTKNGMLVSNVIIQRLAFGE